MFTDSSSSTSYDADKENSSNAAAAYSPRSILRPLEMRIKYLWRPHEEHNIVAAPIRREPSVVLMKSPNPSQPQEELNIVEAHLGIEASRSMSTAQNSLQPRKVQNIIMDTNRPGPSRYIAKAPLSYPIVKDHNCDECAKAKKHKEQAQLFYDAAAKKLANLQEIYRRKRKLETQGVFSQLIQEELPNRKAALDARSALKKQKDKKQI